MKLDYTQGLLVFKNTLLVVNSLNDIKFEIRSVPSIPINEIRRVRKPIQFRLLRLLYIIGQQQSWKVQRNFISSQLIKLLCGSNEYRGKRNFKISLFIKMQF
ncbi:unnamed protein product [Paramecium octaurelia]|uniref:Uncharacterized protein n=1 Tax=Paramecium octaurelia TaxID=43137 RepID=A0A8S1SBA0_PAROT|nr:unnamed protein product [Paramecium octaurelia]